ncbi:MAG: hypothetical protein KY476_19940 [Planctomycetes bacterium]|nr:hypothetical protein [Planctomycetota bacterium]
MDRFGIDFGAGRHTIAENLELPIESGDVVCFTGPSGSGKSSLLRAAADELAKQHGATAVLDIERLELGDRILIEALEVPVDEAMQLLSACGLGEARLMLRTPAELSDGQRYRFRLALGLSHKPRWLVADEFTATLDRTLARVVAYNVRRTADRTGTGFLLATTHEDVLEDLSPSLHVRCGLDGRITVEQAACLLADRSGDTDASQPHKRDACATGSAKKKALSLARRMFLTTGSKRDWPHFSRWHYRGHHLGAVRFVTLLWLCHPPSSILHPQSPTPEDEQQPTAIRPDPQPARAIGICVFTAPPLSLRQRNRFFGLSGRWSSAGIAALNRQLVMLSRVVLDPTFRGAGIAADFIRASCRACPWPWIETQAEMGRLSPFFEKAGFVRVGAAPGQRRSRTAHSAIYGTRRGPRGTKALLTEATHRKSRYARPVYYVFDNRAEGRGTRDEGPGPEDGG